MKKCLDDSEFQNDLVAMGISNDAIKTAIMLSRGFDLNKESLAALLWLMQKSFDGHLAVPLETFYSSKNTQYDFCSLLNDPFYDMLKKRHWVIEDCGSLYLQVNHVYESTIIHHLKRLFDVKVEVVKPSLDLEVCLNAEQQQALISILTNKATIVTGGPGRGKTYVASCALHLLAKDQSQRLLCLAPTGKAVTQLKKGLMHLNIQQDRLKFSTVHKIVHTLDKEISDDSVESVLKYDIIIVDECSMIDAKMWAFLLKSLPSHARLVLLGDSNQLPSVEAGTIFKDLCLVADHFDALNVIELVQPVRTKKSLLLELSDKLRSGDESVLKCPQVRPVQELEKWLTSNIEKFYKKVDVSSVDTDLIKSVHDQKILASNQVGPYGSQKINEFIMQSILIKESMYNSKPIVLPAMANQNDDYLGISNGQEAVVVMQPRSMFEGFKSGDVFIYFDDANQVLKTISATMTHSLELSMAMTIHKSQGSEFASVAIILSEQAESFGREVVYTAVTRAKEKCVVFTNPNTLKKVLLHDIQRISNLEKRLMIEKTKQTKQMSFSLLET